jgi:hypothetical protein
MGARQDNNYSSVLFLGPLQIWTFQTVGPEQLSSVCTLIWSLILGRSICYCNLQACSSIIKNTAPISRGSPKQLQRKGYGIGMRTSGVHRIVLTSNSTTTYTHPSRNVAIASTYFAHTSSQGLSSDEHILPELHTRTGFSRTTNPCM